jgi:hypothetical protein
MSNGRGAAQLETPNAVRTYQRAWLEQTRQRVQQGEPFAICNGDEFEDVLNIMDIPVIVINYYNSIIGVQGKTGHYFKVLADHGYDPISFAMGLATTLDNNPEMAPWGGLPKPAIILGSTKSDVEMKVLEIWAKTYGCPLFPLEFSLDAVPELPMYPPPARWWDLSRDHWDELIDPHRLDLRVQQEKALIGFLEIATGKTLSMARLTEALELINEQMEYWGKARDLIAQTIPCPVTLRDQLSMYQVMWHRGTTRARDFIKSYYEEVKDRVEKGIAANPKEKLRLMWLDGTPPAWAQFAEDKYDAVCVASAFSSIPIDSYCRTILNNDPLRTLAGRHMVLFMETPDWRLKDAQLHQCHGVVQIASPAVPSFNKPLFAASGMPLCEIPRDRDDEEVRSILSAFIETQLLIQKSPLTPL